MAAPVPHRTKATAGLVSSNLAPDPSLGDRVYEALRRDILTGNLKPGEPLSEKLLAKHYGGSRTPIREAAIRLVQDNLIRIIPKKGYFVTHISVRDLDQLCEYRAWLEGACAEAAVKTRHDPELINQMKTYALVQYRSGNRDEFWAFVKADSAFHLGIARLTRNPWFVRNMAAVRTQMERIMYAAVNIAPYGEVTSQEHQQILEAIRRRDAGKARKLLRKHILGAKEKMLELAGASSNVL